MLAGVYQPGSSPAHRAPLWLKFGCLLVISTSLVATSSLLGTAVASFIVAIAYGLAGMRLPDFLAQVRPLRWIVLMLLPFHWWNAGISAAIEITGDLVLLVAAAGVVSSTTRMTDMLDTLVRALAPCRRLGLDPDRVALLLALTIRAVPVVADFAQEVRDAHRARGQERSTRAFVTPVVIRTIRHADQVGEALAARGLDD